MTTTKTIAILLLAAWSVASHAQQHQETINKTLSFEQPANGNVLYIANINGNIKAEGYSGSTIQLEVVKIIKAKSDQRLEEAKSILELGVIDRSDTIFVYIKGVCGTFSNKHNGRWKHNTGWGYNWNDCEQSFDYKMDFTVKVPFSSNLFLSTINEGDIDAEGIQGIVNAKNINGSILLNQISSTNYAHTINGDVTLNIDQQPIKTGSFYSLNGDIVANYQKGLSAELSFKSYNGEFYTNIQQVEKVPESIEITSTDKGEGIAYKLEGRTIVKTRDGGVRLDFETFNGDVYVKENSN